MDGQTAKLIARIAENLPDLPGEVMQYWIQNPKDLQGFLKGLENPWSVVDTTNFKFDKTKKGWTLVEDVGFNPAIKSVKDLILTPFLKDGENSINSEELISRARGKLKANYGQIHAEYLLEHQGEIPEEFRKYYLVFSGTIWRGPDGLRSVPYLCWSGGQWYLDWHWLDLGWYDRDRLLRPRE